MLDSARYKIIYLSATYSFMSLQPIRKRGRRLEDPKSELRFKKNKNKNTSIRRAYNVPPIFNLILL